MYSKFWSKVENSWTRLKPKLLSNDGTALHQINIWLNQIISKKMRIFATFGMVNNLVNCDTQKFVELYISPCDLDNTPIAKRLYATKPESLDCIVVLYKPFLPVEIPSIITKIDNHIIQYADFGYHSIIGLTEKQQPILHIVVSINDDIVPLVMCKQDICFRRTSRPVWLPKNDVIYTLLYMIVGECHMLNHIGYIELQPSSVGKKDNVEFKELLYLLNDVKMIANMRDYAYCKYCNRSEIEAPRIQLNQYCSELEEEIIKKFEKNNSPKDG